MEIILQERLIYGAAEGYGRSSDSLKHNIDWEEEGYSEWAEQERLIREDLKEMRQRKAEKYRQTEFEEDKHE